MNPAVMFLDTVVIGYPYEHVFDIGDLNPGTGVVTPRNMTGSHLELALKLNGAVAMTLTDTNSGIVITNNSGTGIKISMTAQQTATLQHAHYDHVLSYIDSTGFRWPYATGKVKVISV
jgi:hypothetical protein